MVQLFGERHYESYAPTKPLQNSETCRAQRDQFCWPLCKEEFFPSVKITLRHMVGYLENSFVRCDHVSPKNWEYCTLF